MEILQRRQRTDLRKLLAWLVYPISIWLGVGLAIHGVTAHWPQVINYALPLAISLPIIYVSEKLLPLYDSWSPDWRENIILDISLFAINNAVFLLPIIANFIMIKVAQINLAHPLLQLWPNHANYVWQLIFYLVLSDLTQYAYHRLAHEWYPLWRFHCVHHNPKRLYWLNGTRFHTIDMFLIAIVMNVPCVILGATPQVLLIGSVFSVIHGMWQHANAKVRFGWLNYLLSSPELHRWHHSDNMEYANNNYGTNIIIWDIIFRTWLLPENKPAPEAVGVKKMTDQGILRQLLMPLRMHQKDYLCDN